MIVDDYLLLLMTILEECMDKIIAKNEWAMKSYAQVVKDATEGTFHTEYGSREKEE